MSELITHPGTIWLVVEPVDIRRGIDGLSMVVQQTLDCSPCAGSAFVFCNRAGNRVKVLLWDGTGVWLCQRRLHQGRFVWPKPWWAGSYRGNLLKLRNLLGATALFRGLGQPFPPETRHAHATRTSPTHLYNPISGPKSGI